jgi:hypothetical protein
MVHVGLLGGLGKGERKAAKVIGGHRSRVWIVEGAIKARKGHGGKGLDRRLEILYILYIQK